MKQIFLLLYMAGSLLFSKTEAQMHISTNLREDYVWSDNQEKWILVSSDDGSATLFDFNKDMTMMTHTTATISSTYYIKSSVENKENQTWDFEVVSDVGNKYRMLLDMKNNNIRFIGKDKDETSFLVRHTIKRLWFDEQ